MKSKTTSKWILGIFMLAMIGLFLGGCATTGEKLKSALTATDRGTSNEESGGGGRRRIRVRGCWDGESQGEGNKRPVIHGLGP